MDTSIVLPSKPKIIEEDNATGAYEIDGLYPGYGHTLGNSLRRIMLSSLPGAAITSVRIDGVSHEFDTIEGVKQDVITILLNLKKVRIAMHTDEPQTMTLSVSGKQQVTAGDIETPGQLEIVNPDLVIADITDKNTALEIEMEVEKGLGYVSKEVLKKGKVDIGTIALDANFSPIRRVNYTVENMRVGDRTDFNRLHIFIETDQTISPQQVLEDSIEIMINQLKAIIGFQEEEEIDIKSETNDESVDDEAGEDNTELLKTRIESLGISTRTENALTDANIRTVGGLVHKTEDDILDIEGIGNKGLKEVKEKLAEHDLKLKE